MNFDVSSTLGYDCSPMLLTSPPQPHDRAINRPCICQALHLKCDPGRCLVAARAPIPPPARTRSENGYNPVVPASGVMHARYARLQKSALDGCPTCAIIIDGLLTYGIYEKLNAKFDTAIQVDRTGLVTVYSGSLDEDDALGFIRLEIIPDPLQEDILRCQAFALAKLPVQTTASIRSFQDLKAWISACSSEHEACSRVSTSTLPTRVLDIESENISLYESRQEEKAPYITLSYCWGWNGGVLKTTASNLKSFKDGIPWDLLPKTFQDAILIARVVQVRYLWIDALCIVQDDPEDSKRELGMMGDIYQKSYLTIAASQAKDPSYGCFASSKDDPQSKLKSIIARKSPTEPIYESDNPHAKPSGYSIRFTLSHDRFRDRPNKYLQMEPRNIEPLNRRGWTFQERLLSKRIVHYTSQEMVWECETTMGCQCNRIEYVDQSLKVSVSDALRTRKSLLARWIRIIEEYTERNMTYEADRLPALLGVAGQFMEAGMGDYIAGVFTKDIVLLTTWRKRYVPGVLSCEVGVISSEYLGPSWSWVSANSPVYFPTDVELSSSSPRSAAIEVQSVHWHILSPKRGQPVSRAQLIVTGYFFPADSYHGTPPGRSGDWKTLLIRRRGPHSTPNHVFFGEGVFDDPEKAKPKWFKSSTVYCILWSIPRDQTCISIVKEESEDIAYFMLLEKSEGFKDQGGPFYRRLGMGYLPWRSRTDRVKGQDVAGEITASELFENAEHKTITII